MKSSFLFHALVLPVLWINSSLPAADWSRFRGPNGSGLAPDDQPVPTEWSATQNLKWQTELPGPGSSSPIVVGDRVFVTCWSGYAIDSDQGGDLSALKRHLICVDRASGKILWDRAVSAKQPEERYGGMFAQNGYASHTAVSDGTHVFAFFGKSGVHAFDMEGRALWQADVGEGMDRRGWGSASSPLLHGDTLIVPAVVEDSALIAFDKTTGKQLWKSAADGFASTWGTPILTTLDDRTDLVFSVPGEIWGFNPDTGKLRWYSEGLPSDSICNSLVADRTAVYALGERGGGSMAVKLGGSGDVTSSHRLWTGANGPRIPTPILWQDRLYWISGSIAACRDAKTGEEVYTERLPTSSERAVETTGSGRRGGGMGGQDYASPVAANGYLYQVTRRGEVLVAKMGTRFELVARNRIATDSSDHSATPAISNGQLFLRSAKALYCIGE